MPRTRTAVDLFAGAGGATQGLVQAGYRVAGAIENDEAAARTYAANHPRTLLDVRDVRRVQAPAFGRRLALGGHRLDVLTACPPCQGFSTLGNAQFADGHNDLVLTVGRFVEALRPRAVLLENVPGLGADGRLARLERRLRARYVTRRYLVDAADLGVPQHRRRIIVIGIEAPFDGSLFPEDMRALLPCDFDVSHRTAGPAIAEAARSGRGADPVHRARRSSELALRRIRGMRVGGGRFDLPAELRLACHERLATRSATSIYGRIDPVRPAPTMTTRCTTPSCGRFVHPWEDRGLTLREAALLQTFPRDYRFEGPYGEIERQIGNAVPAHLGEALGLVAAALLGDPATV